MIAMAMEFGGPDAIKKKLMEKYKEGCAGNFDGN